MDCRAEEAERAMRIIEIIGEPIYQGGQEAFIMNVLGSMDVTGFTVDALTPYECDNQRFRDLIAKCGGDVKELRFSLTRKILLSRMLVILSSL